MIRKIFLLMGVIVLLAGCAGQASSPALLTPTLLETSTPIPEEETAAPSPTSPPSTTPEQQDTPTTQPGLQAGLIAYIGRDGNLWLVDRFSGDAREVTHDALPWQLGGQEQEQVITFCCPQWSSDGKLLAYRKDTGTRRDDGYQYQFDLWLFDIDTGENRLLLEDQQTAGYAWRPETHQITYGLLIPTEFFMTQDPQLAQGLMGLDVDTGESSELVPPVNGYPLVAPQWSPTGRYVSFEEVYLMEGRGRFAYYDVDAQEYIAWEEVIGNYDWSPDSQWIAYDQLAYTATGTERIRLRERQTGADKALSPEYDQGYAFNPVFSPDGRQLAFLAVFGGPESQEYTLFLTDVPDEGQPSSLGVFDQAFGLDWSPDGTELLFSTGPFEEQQIVIVSVADGESTIMADGSQPAWQP